MICNNCIHQKACINAYASMGYFIDETRENEYKHTILKCKEFEDKAKYQAAIEKQIPKKSLPQYNTLGFEKYVIAYKCPCCGKEGLERYRFNYCGLCGQALDWSE